VDRGPQVALAFDGADDLLRVWTAGLTPDPALTVSAWADRHRVLSQLGASEVRC
jgi:phage terminase large subunit GpA-like protein